MQVFRLVTEHTIEEKIVERAQQKLKLDAMVRSHPIFYDYFYKHRNNLPLSPLPAFLPLKVVQQGRLKDKDKMSRDELLDAVRFGADKIFRSKESSITDDDIDLILNIGKQRTQELNEKLFNAEKGNLLDFKLDGSVSNAQTFEGVDYSLAKLGQAQSEIFGILDFGKRERRQVTNYNENQLYRQMAHQVSAPRREKKKEPKLPKFLRLPRMEEWQMFDREALYALQDIEENSFKNLPEEQKKISPAAWASTFCTSSEPPIQVSDALPFAIPPLLSEEQLMDKKRLLAEGFPDWGRHHYMAFVRACAKFGRKNHEKIAAEVGKPISSIESYSAAIWDDNIGKKRFSEHEYDRVLKLIERGEKKLEEVNSLERCLATLISLFDNPWNELELTYTQCKDKAFTVEEDRHLLCWTHKYGYGQWEAIKMAIRLSPAFRFDYFFRSLPAEAIGKRCEQLLRAVEREVEHLERKVREEAGGEAIDGRDDKNVNAVKLPMYKTIQSKKRAEAERDYEIQRSELENKVVDIENQIEEIQKKLRSLEEPVASKPSSKMSSGLMNEVPDELVPELVNLLAQSGSASISTVANDFISRYPGQMSKKQVFLKIEEVAKKEKREDEGDSKVVWHINDEYSHLLDVKTLRLLRKEKEFQLEACASTKIRHRRESKEKEQYKSQQKNTAIEVPPKTFPDYDPSEQPKECKKAFTHFCVHTRREVKASLDPEDMGDKVGIDFI